MTFKGKKRLDSEDNYLQSDDNIYEDYMQNDNQNMANMNDQNNQNMTNMNVQNNQNINNQNMQNNPGYNNPNNNGTWSYVEKEYKTNTLEENTQITKASAMSRTVLIAFYAFAIVIAVVLFFMIRSNKYEFYLKDEEILLDTGSSYQIELQPKNERYFDYLNYSYSVADEGVATVDEYGTVTAVGTGTTTLKISLKPGLTNTRTMKIVSEEIDVENVNIGVYDESDLRIADSYIMDNNQSITLKAVANNREDLNVSAKYHSSNPAVASVDSFGNVTAKHDGSTIITGEINGVEGSITIFVETGSSGTVVHYTPVPTAKPNVTPKPGTTATPTPRPTATPRVTSQPSKTATPRPSSGTSSSSKVSIGIASQTTKYVGEELQLSAKVDGKSVNSSSVNWSSSKVSVATVNSNGLIKCNAVGTTVITAEVNGSKATATLVVKNKPGSATAAPSKTATPKPSSATPVPESTFDKKYVGFSTQSITVNKGATAKFKVKLYNAAGLFDIKSNNTGIATVDKATLWLDGVSEDDGKPYWAEKEVTVTGVKTGTTTIVITDDAAGIGTYDNDGKELKGKHVINVIVK